MKKPIVYVVGDAMLDVAVRADHYRLDQETGSVPVLPAVGSRRLPPGTEAVSAPGGAANVAANLSALGCAVTLFAPIGTDRFASELRDLLAAAGVSVVEPHRSFDSVTVKARYYASGRMVGRVDRDHDSPPQGVPEGLDAPDALVITDYRRGAVTAGSVRQWAAAFPPAPLFADPHVSNTYLWSDCSAAPRIDTLVANRDEARAFRAVTDACLDPAADPEAVARVIAGATGAARCVVKLGGRGSVLFDSEGQGSRQDAPGSTNGEEDAGTYHEIPKIVPARSGGVLDVQGAGDTYLAAMVAARCRGADPVTACTYASAAAGCAVHMPGTSVPSQKFVVAALADTLCARRGVMTIAEAVALSRRMRTLGVTVGYTNGCFDLRMTEGHLHTLAEASAGCDFLFVGVDSDARVTRLKGAGRPIVSAEERLATVAAVHGVGAAFEFHDEPADVVRRLCPGVLFKGGDYKIESMPEAAALEEVGCRFVNVGAVACKSTTEFLKSLSR